MTDLDDLYSIYRSNIKMEEQQPMRENDSQIKLGDILVALYNNKEVRGEVAAVYENYYLLKGKNGSTLKVTLDDITEHYPKNRTFDNRGNLRKFTESTIQQQPVKNEKPAQRQPAENIQRKTKRVIEEEEEYEERNSPDDQVDLTTHENIKPIGRLVYFSGIKYADIEKMFEKKLLSKDEYWYLLTEKHGEIHVIRNNEKGFQIQPFVNSLVEHFLKNKINEGFNQIKITGNDSFSIISNIPPNVHKQLLNGLISLLSGIKRK